MREVYSLISEANAAFKTIIVALTNRLIKHLEERQIRHISEAFRQQLKHLGKPVASSMYVFCVSAMFLGAYLMECDEDWRLLDSIRTASDLPPVAAAALLPPPSAILLQSPCHVLAMVSLTHDGQLWGQFLCTRFCRP